MGLLLWVPSVTHWILGLLLVGVITLVDRVLPVWAGAAVLIGVAGLVAAVEEFGVLIQGVAWVVVSLSLWRIRRA